MENRPRESNRLEVREDGREDRGRPAGGRRSGRSSGRRRRDRREDGGQRQRHPAGARPASRDNQGQHVPRPSAPVPRPQNAVPGPSPAVPGSTAEVSRPPAGSERRPPPRGPGRAGGHHHAAGVRRRAAGLRRPRLLGVRLGAPELRFRRVGPGLLQLRRPLGRGALRAPRLFLGLLPVLLGPRARLLALDRPRSTALAGSCMLATMSTSHFFAYLSRMKFIRRWGLMHSTYPENIQEHSLRVAQIGHALALIRNRLFGGRVSPERVATLALYHDASEVLTGDLPTPVKAFNPDIRAAYRGIEAAAREKLLSMVPPDLRDDYAVIFRPAESDRDHWELVHAADKLCAYVKCLEEIG